MKKTVFRLTEKQALRLTPSELVLWCLVMVKERHKGFRGSIGICANVKRMSPIFISFNQILFAGGLKKFYSVPAPKGYPKYSWYDSSNHAAFDCIINKWEGEYGKNREKVLDRMILHAAKRVNKENKK